MPAWIHDRAQHIRKKNPGMDEGKAFAIATQQAYAAGKAPKGYGTAEGRKKAKQKYDGPTSQYKKTADPSSKTKTSGFLAFLMGSSNDHHGDAEMLKTKLAGSQTHLATTIAMVLDETRQKMKMAAEAKSEEKSDKVKKLVDYEKKEHGGKIPSPKEEKEECKEEKKEASVLVIDPTDPEEVEKLAAALDEMSEKLADGVVMGGESHQGGEVLPVQSPAAGRQPTPDKGKKTIKVTTDGKPSDSTAAGTIVGTDAKNRVSKDYPAKGVLKTSSVAVLQAALAEETGVEAPDEKPEEKQAKTASAQTAVDYILAKIAGAELGGESPQGGETLASHDKPKMQPGRSLIQNAQGLKNVTKPEAKAARKAELAEVLTEPASKRGAAPNITGNLRSASKGGVKTAAAKALLAKIAEEGCKCEEQGSCPHCKMKKAAAEIQSRQAKDDKTTV